MNHCFAMRSCFGAVVGLLLITLAASPVRADILFGSLAQPEGGWEPVLAGRMVCQGFNVDAGGGD